VARVYDTVAERDLVGTSMRSGGTGEARQCSGKRSRAGVTQEVPAREGRQVFVRCVHRRLMASPRLSRLRVTETQAASSARSRLDEGSGASPSFARAAAASPSDA